MGLAQGESLSGAFALAAQDKRGADGARLDGPEVAAFDRLFRLSLSHLDDAHGLLAALPVQSRQNQTQIRENRSPRQDELIALAQELRNQANNIKTLADLTRRMGASPEQGESLELIEASAEKISELTRNLRNQGNSLEPEPEGRSLTVLVVDDNEINAVLIKRYLLKQSHEPILAEDGAKALQQLGERSVDLVLMDIEMPVMDGIETTRRIREGMAGERNRNLPVVAVTAHPESEFKSLCQAVGMCHYLSKPINFSELSAVIREIFEGCPAGLVKPQAQSQEAGPGDGLDIKQALQRLGNDEAILGELIEVFLEDVEPRTKKLADCVLARDFPNARMQAHSLKGAAATVGAVRLCACAKKLEDSARLEEASNMERYWKDVSGELRGAAKALQSLGYGVSGGAPD